MDNLLVFIVKYLFDNGVIPIDFGGAISLAILGIMAYSAGKDDKFWKDLGLVLIAVAVIGSIFVATFRP